MKKPQSTPIISTTRTKIVHFSVCCVWIGGCACKLAEGIQLNSEPQEMHANKKLAAHGSDVRVQKIIFTRVLSAWEGKKERSNRRNTISFLHCSCLCTFLFSMSKGHFDGTLWLGSLSMSLRLHAENASPLWGANQHEITKKCEPPTIYSWWWNLQVTNGARTPFFRSVHRQSFVEYLCTHWVCFRLFRPGRVFRHPLAFHVTAHTKQKKSEKRRPGSHGCKWTSLTSQHPAKWTSNCWQFNCKSSFLAKD